MKVHVPGLHDHSSSPPAGATCAPPRSLALLAGAALLLVPRPAAAGGLTLSVEAPAAVPVAESQAQRFGVGLLPSIAVLGSVMDGVHAGVRCRAGALTDRPQMDPTLAEVGAGGVVSGAFAVRARPGSWVGHPSLGIWLEATTGVAITGPHVRPTYELALGWRFDLGRVSTGPSARYMYIRGVDASLDSRGAHLALVGVDIGFRSARPVSLGQRLARTPHRMGKPRTRTQRPRVFALDSDRIADSEQACPLMITRAEQGCALPDEILVENDRFALPNRVLFDNNRARVKRAGKRALALVVAAWHSHPEWSSITIEGHADQRGPEDYNVWLSQERALRVRRALVELGLPAEQLSSTGLGSGVPRVEGASRSALDRNRRVEFVILTGPPRGAN